MKEQGLINGVMYALYHVRDLEEVRANNYMYNIYDQFKEKFSNEMQRNTINAIEWALQQDDIEDVCTLPNLPNSAEFKREYLAIVLAHLKQEMKNNI